MARALFDFTGSRHAALGALLAAFILGLPLFFETGVVLLLPIIAAGMENERVTKRKQMVVTLSALAGLSVLHALVPPHPGPLVAAGILNAQVGVLIPIGLLAAIPTALIAGPILARFTTRNISSFDPPPLAAPRQVGASPVSAALTLMFPVALIAIGAIVKIVTGTGGNVITSTLVALSDPVMALFLANLVALATLFPKQFFKKSLNEEIWTEAIRPAAGIVLSIGAGGAVKQVLVASGLPSVFSALAEMQSTSPLIIAWLVAAAIRVATGSATVATITAAGIMTTAVNHSAIRPEWFVLAIGSGSVFLSHVNDPGFWLVKGYLGTSVGDTLRLWTNLENVVSIVGLLSVLALWYIHSLV